MKRKHLVLPAFVAALAAGLILAIGASADTLPGGAFEIDNPAGNAGGANLILDPGPGSIDWASVPNTGSPNESRQQDQPTGQNDDSYSGGSKEDDPCPGTTTGSIPNNKSDLQFFGGYKEPVAGGPGILNVFWQRVNDPSGTTNMDFEFNKSTTPCAAGAVNMTRSVGDILLQFDVDNGGSQAHLSKRTWNGSSWGAAQPLSASVAIGSINTAPISAANSDGLISSGSLAARTFGEASFDLASVFDPLKCESFGSAMLKSRSSDAFNSQLKDFIRPIPLNIQNCAQVIIRKQTDPDGDTQTFGYTKAFTTDPTSVNTFSLADGGVKDFGKTVIFGTGLTVTEDSPLPTDWQFVSLDCSASSASVPAGDRVVSGQTVTFTLNSADDILDCTYNNKKQLGALKVTKASIKGNTALAGAVFTIGNGVGDKTTGAGGSVCVDHLAFGTYSVVEKSAPAGYAIDDTTSHNIVVDSNSDCSNVTAADTLNFNDTPLTDIDVSANSQDDGPGGTLTTITCKDGATPPVNLPGSPTSNVHDPSLSVDNLKPGTYTCTLVIDP